MRASCRIESPTLCWQHSRAKKKREGRREEESAQGKSEREREREREKINRCVREGGIERERESACYTQHIYIHTQLHLVDLRSPSVLLSLSLSLLGLCVQRQNLVCYIPTADRIHLVHVCHLFRNAIDTAATCRSLSLSLIRTLRIEKYSLLSDLIQLYYCQQQPYALLYNSGNVT